MTSIRALMLAQQARHSEFISVDREPTERCAGCSEWWPCVERVAADAVIAHLDAADWQYDKQRLVPDPGVS